MINQVQNFNYSYPKNSISSNKVNYVQNNPGSERSNIAFTAAPGTELFVADLFAILIACYAVDEYRDHVNDKKIKKYGQELFQYSKYTEFSKKLPIEAGNIIHSIDTAIEENGDQLREGSIAKLRKAQNLVRKMLKDDFALHLPESHETPEKFPIKGIENIKEALKSDISALKGRIIKFFLETLDEPDEFKIDRMIRVPAVEKLDKAIKVIGLIEENPVRRNLVIEALRKLGKLRK